MTRVMVSARTYRALVFAAGEHRLDVDQMATMCVAAAAAAWRGGQRSAIPAEDPGDIGDAAIVIRMTPLVAALVAGRADGAGLLLETQLRLILDVAVRDYVPIASPPRPAHPPYQPRRWRPVAALVSRITRQPSGAEITAAILGDPSHRTSSVQVTRAGRQVSGDNFG